jgi:hypothetical protein
MVKELCGTCELIYACLSFDKFAKVLLLCYHSVDFGNLYFAYRWVVTSMVIILCHKLD